ncbi:DUF11 domain-containing protein [bacterium]|nr:DUF11 domain-containing protein [bacterium]
MDQQKKKSKTITNILFTLLGILILALVGAIIYFYLIGDIFQKEEDLIITCGCYYIDPQVTDTCGDTKRAFKFNTSTGTLNECSASCPLTELSPNMLNSTTLQEAYITCTTKNVPSTKCNAMEIKTKEGLTVTGKINPEETITITATFDSTQYTDHKFLINNVPSQPDETTDTTISKTLAGFGDDSTLQISAQAVDSTGDTVSSIICNRLIEITTTTETGVSALTLDTYTSSGKTIVQSALISAGGLKDTSTTIKFSFKDEVLTMINGFELDPDKGRITITESNLYNSLNFVESKSFSALDTYQGDVTVTAEVLQDNISLGTATEEIILSTTQDDQTQEEDEDDTTATKSQFNVTKASSETCVERVSPDNSSTFTITIRNNGEETDTIESIKDKLPLGFEYVASSSTLNGNPIADSVFVTTSDIGQSQEIVWEPQNSWSIDTGETLIISFNAIAGSASLTGTNLNEVIVTPSEIPEDPATLSSSIEIVVAQDCDDIDTTVPQTGIFDSIVGRIFFGIATIMIGIIIYNTNRGTQLATMVINSNTYRNAEMTSYKIFSPKRYFEERLLERRERER